jgi:serine protease Do
MYDPLRDKARIVFWSAAAFLTGIGIATGFGWTQTSMAMPAVEEAPQVTEAAVRPALDLSDAFVNVAEVVTPAVVRIEATRRPSGDDDGESQDMQGVPEPLQRFFRPQPERPRTAGGSGFIVSPDGYVMTNDHVVSGASEVRVHVSDGRYFDAEVVGSDPFTDVAVLKMDADETFASMSLGDSDRVQVGQWVLAIGSPGFGGGSAQLENSVTAGIVSARGRGLGLIQRELQRELQDPNLSGYAIEDFIQTDAVINPGNSGGPMVDLQGRVIGINSAIYSPTGFYQGYGFAIPVNLARRIMEDLIEYGQVRRARLGVSIVDVAPEDAEAFDLPSVSGVLVQGVEAGTPGARAGLEQGDVITAIEGRPVGYTGQLQGRIAMYRPGDEVTLTVYRDGEPRDIDVTLGEAPINDLAPAATAARPAAVERLGISVQEMTPEVAQQWGYEEPGGVVVTQVAPASPAARRNILQGAKIEEINGREITGVDDVRAALDAVEGGAIVQFILADRFGGSRIVNVRMPGG